MSYFGRRAGMKSFDRCEVKDLDSGKEGYYKKVILVCPRTKDNPHPLRVIGEYGSTPETEVVRELRKIAGQTLCAKCVYKDMTKLEAAQYDTKVSNAQILKQKASIRQLELTQQEIALRRQVQEEYSQLDPNFQTDTGSTYPDIIN